MKRLFTLLAAGALASACGSDNNNNSGTVNLDPNMSPSAIASAIAGAGANSTILFAAGTYHLNNSLNLPVANNITVKGAGMTSTILDFATQTGGADGLVQTIGANQTIQVTFQDLAIQDTAGNGIKVTGGNKVHFNHVKVSWPTRSVHGGYGIYPVQSKNVLAENCVVSGASDTGIYVGQSDGIVVMNNELFENVAGIEIENSFNADVHDNNSHDNTVGFLVFDLPNLQQVGGHNIRVFNNQLTNNNHLNFGDASGTVAKVPGGTGGAVMANHDVEIFGNTFTGNTAAGFSAISCLAAFSQSDCINGTAGYSPVARNIHVHNNTFTSNGTDPTVGMNPDPTHPSNQLAELLASGFVGTHPWLDNHVSDVSWDGILLVNTGDNPYSICAHDNGTGHFADLHLADWQQAQTGGPQPLGNFLSFDGSAFNCTLPALPAVTLPSF
ncbi:MAG TPA: parallel beta-helix domain-containing protein [Myxococcaceae bacterium]|nr:parallel beta-helix domain-containing protein [Myxococcaceae bacterium]